MAVHILGIRHHGVGSAKNVLARLKEIQPDLIFVEGPPEIDDMLQIIGRKELKPPAAIMLYDEKNLGQSSFYPFAEYSPEWVAAAYANENSIPLRAMDLPANISFAIAEKERKAAEKAAEVDELEGVLDEYTFEEKNEQREKEIIEDPTFVADPLSYLAQAAGFPLGEAWWDHQFETVRKINSVEEQFEAVMLAMQTLREENIPSSLDKENVYREAYMRYLIRYAQNEMYSNIAVICGAWHAPALLNIDEQEKDDMKIIKKLPKTRMKVTASWIPWTNGRLARVSGYGAGITNPGWYEHQWKAKKDSAIKWLTHAAKVFRKEQIDVSTAHVIESYRLSHSLATLRNHSTITYGDLNDSIKTVMCDGDEIVYDLISKKLNVNEKIGKIPDDLPKVPLQKDFDTSVKSLRLKLSAMPKDMDLDLRKPLDLKRSIFFHRLEIIGIPWASKRISRSKGTFKESWELVWNPEMEIQLIDNAHFGNTIPMAARGIINEKIANEKQINVLVGLIENTIPAELFQSMDDLLVKINDETSISSDTRDLMKSLPQLIHISRYGDVRNTDVERITHLCHRLFQKIEVSIVNACYGLDEDNSNQMFELISELNKSIKLIQDEETTEIWQERLKEIMSTDGIHMVIKGCTIRMLFDQSAIEETELSTLLQYYLSPAQDAFDVAFWIEGFLRGSGLILIYDNKIWNLIYEWVDSITPEQFLELVPVLRRAFSKFPFGERRRIGEKAKSGLVHDTSYDTSQDDGAFDHESATAILPFITKYLG